MRNPEVEGNEQSYCKSCTPGSVYLKKGHMSSDQDYTAQIRQFTYRRNVGFIGSTVVVAQQSIELQRVELEAGVVYVLHVLHGVFVHCEEGRCLERQKVSHQIRTVVFKPFSTSTTFNQTRISPSHYQCSL